MYYVIEINYAGPDQDQDQYIDVDVINISTSPATTNSSNEVRTDGWCGTTNDWATYAHGEYTTLDEARAYIKKKFGELRDCDANGDKFEYLDDEDVVETYKIGKYEPLGTQATVAWAYERMYNDIKADTSDFEIMMLSVKYKREAKFEGFDLHEDLLHYMLEQRDQLREEMNNE